jgi:hypothetical protein
MTKFTIQHATELMQSVADGTHTLSADEAKIVVDILKYQATLVSTYAASVFSIVKKMKEA